MRAAFTFFPVKKSKQKRPVQKKAIAKHRSFSSQNAFSIVLVIIRLLLLLFCEDDRRTFGSYIHYRLFFERYPRPKALSLLKDFNLISRP